MGLSRLSNFLKSSRGNILYVDPNSLDSTDSIENQGNSLTRPFKTIQRALVESARFSYQSGLNNDRFGRTTILIYPGEHTIDNRPGFIPDGAGNFRLRNGATTNDLSEFDLSSNFDVESNTNELYKLNSIHGGVIVPRGTSIVGLDLRKTKIRPKYVPDPENDDIERSAIFRITGACYFWQFSIFDGDPNGNVYKDYTNNTHVPNFSHHKLTCFEYADGKNNVVISDAFNDNFVTERTDLDMYYEKVSLVYGSSSGRGISPEYPSEDIDIQKKIDEYRIVGSTGGSSGISSIRSGDGVEGTTVINVKLDDTIDGLEVDTPFRIQGITAVGYNGQYVVKEKISSTEITFNARSVPSNILPAVTNSTLTLSSDTVSSASPYIFNLSLRSVFGMCGMQADGSKADGFKSMVVAQFTGIGLQKDDKAFVVFNEDEPPSGLYNDSTSAGNETISNNSRARHKPTYRNFHIKCSNNSVIQAVSCFAIGYAEQFVTESGGDISLTNSNSNFGAVALVSDGYRETAFSQDDQGYISHIIPPREFSNKEITLEFDAIDVLKTLPQSLSAIGVGSTGRMYLFNQKNSDSPPNHVLQGYTIGSRENDAIRFVYSQESEANLTEYSARIVMPNTEVSSEKVFKVGRSSIGINSIGSNSEGGFDNVILLTESHNFSNGETVRVLSENGHLPDGLDANEIYYAITPETFSGITTSQEIKLAKSFNDAINDSEISINSKGGNLKIVSRVSDKSPNDLGHPIQFDTAESQWYVNVSTAATENNIFSTLVGFGSTSFGTSTPRTFIRRKNDNRGSFDRLYHIRYVIPRNSTLTARPPVDGFVLQESTTTAAISNDELNTYFGTSDLTNENQQRNLRFIADAVWNSSTSTANITTELPHNLTVGSNIEITNVVSSENTLGTQNFGFNRQYSVTGISSAKQFSVGLSTDPGTISNNINLRTVSSLPSFRRTGFEKTYYTYRINEHQKYIKGEQDGVYYLTLLEASISPTVAPFTELKYSQPVKNLYPQISKDNPLSDPKPALSHAKSSLIGQIDVNDPRNSITRKSKEDLLLDANVGLGIASIESSDANTHIINTVIDHGLNPLVKLSITSAGSNYGTLSGGDEVYYNARLVGSDTEGKHATAKVTVSGTDGSITNVHIMDGGSAFTVGDTVSVVGIATTTNHTQSTLTVDKVRSDIGKVLRISGISEENNQEYNGLYRITSIGAGAATSISVSSANEVSNFQNSLITNLEDSLLYLTGDQINITSLDYDFNSGIATVISSNNHGLYTGKRVLLSGANESIYNGSFVITKILDDLSVPTYSFSVNIGVGTTSPSQTGTMFGYPEGHAPSETIITKNNEHISNRMSPLYAGISTNLSQPIGSSSDTNMRLQNVDNYDIKNGDYFMINDEIVRVKRPPSTSSVTGNSGELESGDAIFIFRGALGTQATTHSANSSVKKIDVLPVEFRRHSIIRASGHTFEYVGYGPGNYSTGFPEKQDREISSQEEILAQSTKRNGGINFYTGMNDKGISYSGNKRLSTITGKEEIFETPVQTFEGDDVFQSDNLNVITPLEGVFARSIRVDGGESGETLSEFNGPLIVNNKIVVTSDRGVETNNLYLQGDATVSRKYTVGVGTPTLAGNPGDVVYNANPEQGAFAGWIYTKSNSWKAFGTISLERESKEDLFSKVGIGTTTPLDKLLLINSGSNQVSVDANGRLGIGTSASPYKLNVIGDSIIDGTVKIGAALTVGSGVTVNSSGIHVVGISSIDTLGIATIVSGTYAGMGVSVYAVGSGQTAFYYGDGSNLVNLNADQTGWIRQGDNLTYEDVLNGRVGIGTSIPDGGTATDFLLGYSLTVGSATVGASGTSLHVHDGARVTGQLVVDDGIHITSGITSFFGQYDIINNTKGNITGTSATFSTKLNISGFSTFSDTFISGVTTSSSHTYLHSYSEDVGTSSINTGNGELTLDLSTGQNFEVTISQAITKIILTNVPSTSSSMTFSIKFTQSSDANYSVDIDDFEYNSSSVIVYWPGNVVPVVSRSNGAIDIYSFKTFNTANLNNVGLYGIIGGQNFS